MGDHKLKDANIYIDCPVADESQESLLEMLLRDLSHCQTLYLNIWCIQYSPKTVKVEAFTGQAMEMQTLKFLLENAMVLEKLDLCDTDSLHETDMVKSFKKASPDARIAIINEFDG
ncbi:F-box/LRR-repeat protein [Tanacetum coccineum]